MNVCGKCCSKVSQQLFNILVTVMALAASEEVLKASHGKLSLIFYLIP